MSIPILMYHQIGEPNPKGTPFRGLTVHPDSFARQMRWMRRLGYRGLSMRDVMPYVRGERQGKVFGVTFDDGYRSFYTRVLPILKAYGWPALLAPVGVWMDTPADKPVDFGGSPEARDRFLTWDQIREISRSGLVEIAAHTNASHYGALANPQGNTEPAAAIRAYNAQTRQYETEAQFNARMGRDVAALPEKIRRVTGHAPRVWTAPDG
ncbi:hypothetical protein G6F68_012415 [Rhizopus microsporus]|nr:hypothetical protein G6F68_012415 [Rhizopus microsporus]